MEELGTLLTTFGSQLTAIAGIVIGSTVFMIPVAIKFMGKSIGFTKSLMGTGRGRRR